MFLNDAMRAQGAFGAPLNGGLGMGGMGLGGMGLGGMGLGGMGLGGGVGMPPVGAAGLGGLGAGLPFGDAAVQGFPPTLYYNAAPTALCTPALLLLIAAAALAAFPLFI